MHRTMIAILSLLALVAGGCTVLGDQAERLQEGAADAADRARFCFTLARALTAIEGGASLTEASNAAEEVLAQAPDELRPDAEVIAERLRQAADTGDASVLDSDEVKEAAERLRDGSRRHCDPTS